MAGMSPRMTIPPQLVLQALLQDPGRELYGVEVGDVAGLPSGTVHPILARLEGLGWLDSGWEDVDPSAAGRPRRRFYRLTAAGAAQAEAAIEAADARRSHLRARRPTPLVPGFGPAQS